MTPGHWILLSTGLVLFAYGEYMKCAGPEPKKVCIKYKDETCIGPQCVPDSTGKCVEYKWVPYSCPRCVEMGLPAEKDVALRDEEERCPGPR